MSTSMLSLCCGALPVGGVVRTCQTYHGGQTYHLGTCSYCGERIPFAPHGVPETSPKWLRLPPLHELPRTAKCQGCGKSLMIGEVSHCFDCNFPLAERAKLWTSILDRQSRRITLWLCLALAGWLAFIALGTWRALHRGGEGEGGQRGLQGLGEQSIGSSHAPKGSIKAGGGQ